MYFGTFLEVECNGERWTVYSSRFLPDLNLPWLVVAPMLLVSVLMGRGVGGKSHTYCGVISNDRGKCGYRIVVRLNGTKRGKSLFSVNKFEDRFTTLSDLILSRLSVPAAEKQVDLQLTADVTALRRQTCNSLDRLSTSCDGSTICNSRFDQETSCY